MSGRRDAEALASDLRVAVDSLAEDLQTLSESLEQLATHMDETEERLARRSNEMLLSGALAQRPPAGVADRIFVSDDEPRLYYDLGSAWVSPGVIRIFTPAVVAAQRSVTLAVAMTTATYFVVVEMTWWSAWRWTTKTATTLTIDFAVPAPAGAQLRVGLL